MGCLPVLMTNDMVRVEFMESSRTVHPRRRLCALCSVQSGIMIDRSEKEPPTYRFRWLVSQLPGGGWRRRGAASKHQPFVKSATHLILPSYSRWYPKNRRSRTTFSYLTNTMSRRSLPEPRLFASFLNTLLIL